LTLPLRRVYNTLWAGRDIVVIGGSAGGIAALKGVVAELPARLAATLFATHPVGADRHDARQDFAGGAREKTT
jgi:chemotaxis response regulator CheB